MRVRPASTSGASDGPFERSGVRPGRAANQAPPRQGPALNRSAVLALQASSGNTAVAQLLRGRPQVQRSACCSSCAGGGPCDDQTSDDAADRVATVSVQRTIGDGHDLTSPRFAGDPKLEACFDDQARLTRGSSGPPVRAVQQALVDLGYDLGPSGADAQYGSRTWEAVKRFKADQDLGWTHMGDVGPGTMKRLNEIFPGGGGGGGDGVEVEGDSMVCGTGDALAVDEVIAHDDNPFVLFERPSLQRDGDPPKTGAPPAGKCPVPSSLASFTQQAGMVFYALVAPNIGANGKTLETTVKQQVVNPDKVGLPGQRSGQTAAHVTACKATFAAQKTFYRVKPGDCTAANPQEHRADTEPECESKLGKGMDAADVADNPRLLEHEQFHVKLACKVAEQASTKLPANPDAATVKKAAAEANKRQVALNKKYDTESKHGCVATKQQEWETAVNTGTFP